ncbi:holo-acyl-carrier-protein synthase [mine drainage metagenome]
MRAPVLWRSIGTAHNALGAPQLVFEEPLGVWLQARGITRTWLSITDEKSHAFACVVLEGT